MAIAIIVDRKVEYLAASPPNYCLRYRPAAPQAQMVESSTTHVGFRCVMRVASA